jgi:hypothetical protein
MTSDPHEPTPAEDDHPHQPESDEADRDKETSPAGVAGDLEEKAEELGATAVPEEPQGQRPAR